MTDRIAERSAAEAAFREVLAQSGEQRVNAGWGTDMSTFLRRASPLHGDVFLIITDRRVLMMPVEQAAALARDGVTPEVLNRQPVPFSVRRDAVTASRHRRRGFGHIAEFELGRDVMTINASRTLAVSMLGIMSRTGPVSDRVVDPGLVDDDLDARCTACATRLTSVTAFCPGCARDLAWDTPEAVAIRAELRRRHGG